MKELESNNYGSNRDRVIEIYGGCANCGTEKHLTTHHIIPRCEGGSNHKGNLIALCVPCHRHVEQMIGEHIIEKKPIVIYQRKHKKRRK